MLTVVGGTYLEVCHDPHWHELYGSGLRGAAALSGNVVDLYYESCVGEDMIPLAEAICSSFGIKSAFTLIPKTISFNYYHPLSKPVIYPITEDSNKKLMPTVSCENILLYGQIEAEVKIIGSYVVYDPQNWVSFKQTGSTAEHLALVLNRHEALHLTGLPDKTELILVGKTLLEIEKAEVIIIKNGSRGALVIDASGSYEIPVFRTSSVWPIGSGDIFSAAFAWKWAIEKKKPHEAALLASCFTAQYCQNKTLPLLPNPCEFQEIKPNQKVKQVYLAGPFFTISERWLVNELRNKLLEFGNQVFSPFHDVGLGIPEQVVTKDLEAIKNSDTMLAIINNLDPGTLFEIGYAKALEKRVIVLAENIKHEDLTMLIGTNCEITNDLSTAVYKASW